VFGPVCPRSDLDLTPAGRRFATVLLDGNVGIGGRRTGAENATAETVGRSVDVREDGDDRDRQDRDQRQREQQG
jgi:hypothetical protein